MWQKNEGQEKVNGQVMRSEVRDAQDRVRRAHGDLVPPANVAARNRRDGGGRGGLGQGRRAKESASKHSEWSFVNLGRVLKNDHGSLIDVAIH